MLSSDDTSSDQMPAIFLAVFASFNSVITLAVLNHYRWHRKFHKEGDTDVTTGTIISKSQGPPHKGKISLKISVEFETTRACDGMQLRVHAEDMLLCIASSAWVGDGGPLVTPPLEGDDVTFWDTLQPGSPVTITHLKDDPTACIVKRSATKRTVHPFAQCFGWICSAVLCFLCIEWALAGPCMIVIPFILGLYRMNSVAILGPLLYVTVISIWIIALRSSRFCSNLPNATVTELGYQGGYARMESGNA